MLYRAVTYTASYSTKTSEEGPCILPFAVLRIPLATEQLDDRQRTVLPDTVLNDKLRWEAASRGFFCWLGEFSNSTAKLGLVGCSVRITAASKAEPGTRPVNALLAHPSFSASPPRGLRQDRSAACQSRH